MLCGSAFKNKGVQTLLDAVVDYPAVAARRAADQGHRLRRRAPRSCARVGRREPLSMLAFKIMDDPFVGTLTFCRIYSGKLEERHGAHQLRQGQARARRPHAADACEQRARRSRRPSPATSSRSAGLKDTRPATRCATDEAGDPGAHGVPRAGHRDRRSSRSPRPTRRRWAWRSASRCRGPVVPRGDRSGIRPDDHQGHGRAAPRHQGRHHEARRTRSRPTSARRRSPIARRSRSAAEVDYTHKKQTGGTGQFARVEHRARAAAARRRLRVRERGRRRQRCRRNTSRASRRASSQRFGQRRARRLPDGRHQGDADRRRSTTRWTLRRSPSRSPRARRCAKALQKARPVLLEPIMKVEVVTPGRLCGRGDRRLNSPAWAGPGPGDARQRQRSSTRSCRSPTCSDTSSNLRSMSQGRAQYTMQFDHYEQVPSAVAEGNPRRSTPDPSQAERQVKDGQRADGQREI